MSQQIYMPGDVEDMAGTGVEPWKINLGNVYSADVALQKVADRSDILWLKKFGINAPPTINVELLFDAEADYNSKSNYAYFTKVSLTFNGAEIAGSNLADPAKLIQRYDSPSGTTKFTFDWDFTIVNAIDFKDDSFGVWIVVQEGGTRDRTNGVLITNFEMLIDGSLLATRTNAAKLELLKQTAAKKP